MLFMIFQMTAVTLSYVFLTSVLWKYAQKRKMTSSLRIAVGVIYGLCAVMSTHFGVDYSHMMLNVRDMGPLSAGLFFDPVSGILAGLIGGIERYIAGTYWGVGSYTRIACAISTCLAGFVAAAMHIFIFKRKKPSAMYAYFMGAVMEVFHMYVVFITHREDMNMALYVVKTCGPPMIVFTGLGMAASSIALKVIAGEWKNPFRKVEEDGIPVSVRFHPSGKQFTVVFVIDRLRRKLRRFDQSPEVVQSNRHALGGPHFVPSRHDHRVRMGPDLEAELARLEVPRFHRPEIIHQFVQRHRNVRIPILAQVGHVDSAQVCIARPISEPPSHLH